MTKRKDIKNWIQENKIYIGSFFIPFIIMLGVCIACEVEPFGDRSLVIIDGLHQYMPFFSEYHEKLRNLDSLFYSWNGGLGYNFLSLWSYYLSSPLNLIIVLFPKTMLNLVVSFLIVLKISLLGLTTACFFISRSHKNNWKVLIFSTAFALSNYIIGYSWNVMWLDSIIMFPLVLIGFDRMMEKKDSRMYCWTLALAMIGNFYIAFMICIFLVLWFLFYPHPLKRKTVVFKPGKMRNCLEEKEAQKVKMECQYEGLQEHQVREKGEQDIKIENQERKSNPEDQERISKTGDQEGPSKIEEREAEQPEPEVLKNKIDGWQTFYEVIKRGVLFGFCSVLSAAMAAIGLLPAYLGIMNTASADLMTLPQHEWYTNLFDIMSTHLAVTSPITNDNFDGNANLYIGMLAIVLICLYVFGRRISLGSKIKRVIFLAIFIVSFNEKLLNFIWHGFHDQYGIPNRFAFLYLFLIMLTGFEVLEKIKAVRWRHTLAAMAASFLLTGLLIIKSDKEIGIVSIGVSLGLVLFYGAVIFFYSVRKMKLKACTALLLAAALIETGAMTFYGFNENGQIDVPKFFSDTEAIREIKEEIGEAELVRTDLISSKMLDEEIWHNLKCVTMFGSTANGQAVSMMNHLGFYTGANEYLYKGATPVTNLLLNVKYNIRREDDKNLNDFRIVKSYSGMDLLENPIRTSIGYGVEGDLSEWYYESAYPFRVQNDFVLQAYGMEEIFHDIPIPDPSTNDCEISRTNDGEYSFKNTSSQADNLVFTIPTFGGEDLYIHYDGSQVTNAIVKVGNEIRVSKKINSEIYHIGLVETGEVVTVSLQLADDELKQGIVRLSAADFDQGQFESLAEKMAETGVRVTYYDSNSLKGTVTMKEDGFILFSIPYDTGWTVKVDGTETGIEPVADGLLGVPVAAGSYSLELTYVSPGFYTGILLTIGGLIFYLILWIMTVKKQKITAGLEGKFQRKLRHKAEDVV